VNALAEKMKRFPVRAVYTSPLERTVETAEAIARVHGLEPVVSRELGELHFGEWEGQRVEDIRRQELFSEFNTFRSGTRCPGGELMIETQTRMVRELDRLRSLHSNETVAIVSHGDPLRSVVAHYLGIPLDFILRFEILPASLSIVEVEKWGPRVLCVNGTGDALP
jgi:probable phosphoglycerate mutase